MMPSAVEVVNNIERAMATNHNLEFTIRSNSKGGYYVLVCLHGSFLAAGKGTSLADAVLRLFEATVIRELLVESSSTPPEGEKSQP